MKRDSRIYCHQGPDYLPSMQGGELSGTGFVFKDLFDVAGYTTGAGNPQWLATHPQADATSPLISALLRHGAECVGRVQTDELAYSLNGQNVHYGTPVNPAAPDCLPGGSSSGCAVAVAAGDCDFAIGTDTGGSVRVPASYCGLFGLRPALGSLNLNACFELAKSFDTAGILSRDLSLLRQVWQVLSATTLPLAEKQKSGDTVTCSALYLDNQCAEYLSEPRFQRLQQWCRAAGVSLVHGDFLTAQGWTLSELSLLFRTIQGHEIIQKHDPWLTRHGASLDPAIWERVIWARSVTQEQLGFALQKQAIFKLQLTDHLKQVNALWVLPTTPSGPPALTMPVDELAVYRSQLMGLTSLAGLSGMPQLHLPMHDLPEGPCGMSLLGQAGQEEDLIATGVKLTAEEAQRQGEVS
ncbi:Biuret hydrolase [Vibrio aerogenes CECT 7868]|uniref:Biuret hydrolase n=1 Tax=Vibrio aerogenes CECT 7868 TaxID=1216006 RepID=A0A1M5Z3L6_9VIBR|nr:amidase [Vibrio aerogenes]SHI18866.1 Biuret hydrolase [Vibrio aerogenes CECT 7868]